jgi:cephalosporin-C deacetylase
MAMFRHAYPFDPTHEYDLDALLAVVPPDPPADFAAFWRDLQARAGAVTVAPTLRELMGKPVDYFGNQQSSTAASAWRETGLVT